MLLTVFVLVIILFSLFQNPIIHFLHLNNSISKLKFIRLYVVLLISFMGTLSVLVYIANIINITHVMWPFTLLILMVTVIYGMKVGLFTFFLSFPVIFTYLIAPYNIITISNIITEKSISSLLSLASGVIAGGFIRLYHQILGNKVDDLQNLYWHTRQKLASTTNEQEILQAIDKASLAVTSVEEKSLDTVLSIIAQEAKNLLGVYHAGIGLMQEDVFIPRINLQDQKKILYTTQQNTSLFEIIAKILKSKRLSPIIVDISKASQLLGNNKIRFLYDKILIAPIFTQSTILGGIFVTSHKEKLNFTDNDIKKIGLFAAHAALAISNSRKQEELEMLIKMRDQFASVASHELKTPLSAIKLYTQLLQAKFSASSDIQVEKSLSTINQEANKLTTLINTLLDFSRLQTGKFTLDTTRFNLVEICKHNIAIMQVINPTYTFNFESRVKFALVIADRIRIEQVIVNLLTNAVRYSPKATTITLRLTRSDKGHIVSIKDHGLGIGEEEQQRIFEPFFQTQNSIQSKQGIQGLGLGLYISHQIIAKHNGKLWVESKKGKGSTFHVLLPVKQHKVSMSTIKSL